MPNTIGIRELAERAKKEGAFDLAQGVINSPPPATLMDAVRKIDLEKCSTYTNKRGVPEYRAAIVEYLASRGWPVKVANVMSVAGVMAGITSSLLTDCRPGAKVILPEPFFIAHKILLNALGFKLEFICDGTAPSRSPFIRGRNNAPAFHIDWNEIIEKMKDAAAMLITTPANPTGQIASPAILARLSEAAVKNNCLLVVDEMYREFIWDHPPIDDSGYQKINFSKTILLRSFSKTFAIPGWRIGFAVTSPQRVEAMATTHDALYLGGSTIAQYALAAGLSNNLDSLNQFVEQLRARLLANKTLLSDAFRQYGLTPLPVSATYYLLLKHDRPTDMGMVEELMAKKIATTPVSVLFDDPNRETGYIRAHIAVNEDTAKKVADILNGRK